ncbi:MAG: hypothetical protein Q8R55_07755 [Candidatus Taylorbacteria bacterium]|nr:hypothetical protein [Candidatus Taylorbacteria bacterium]
MDKIKTILVFTSIALIASIYGFSANAQTAPSITTGEAVFIAPRNVYLNARVNPNGSYTNVWFQIDTVQPPTGVRGYQGAGSGTSAINLQAGVINLRLDTTYYYRAVGQNSAGFVYGEVRSFRTSPDGGAISGTGTSGSNTSSNYTANSNYSSYSGSSGSSSGIPLAPTVATNGPVSVSSNSAVINGSINPNNANTTFWFEFGTTQSFGQKTSVQSVGAGNAWQLVTGNLSGLETGKTYYYRVVAQNSQGTSFGEVKSFTTGAGQTGQTVTQASQNSGGQVLGLATTSGNGRGTSTASRGVTPSRPQTPSNPRPSFISLEYSLADNGALVLVANDAKPKPGEEFTYTVVYKNDSQYSFNEANLKIIIPSEADYLGADIEPNRVSGSVVEFELDNIAPEGRGTVSVTVKIKETVKSGVSMIFTSVLGYKDRFGTQLATTSYMTVRAGEAGLSGGSSPLLGSLGNISGIFWLAVIGLIVLIGLLAFWLTKIKNGKGKKTEEKDIFGMRAVPPTFEQVSDGSFLKK